MPFWSANFTQIIGKSLANMEKVEIINAMVDELRKRGLIQKQKDIAESLGMNVATVSSAINGRPNGCTQSFIFRLNEGYESLFNPEWLISGKGHMLKHDADIAAEAAASAAATIHQQNAEHCSAFIGQNGDDAMAVQILQMRVQTLEKDNTRLEAEKARLEARCDELQQAIIKQLNK